LRYSAVSSSSCADQRRVQRDLGRGQRGQRHAGVGGVDEVDAGAAHRLVEDALRA
jgi:hypothetical protein